MAKSANQRKTQEEIERLVRGMDADEVLWHVKEHVRKTQKFTHDTEVYAYWKTLTEEKKVDVIKEALS